MLYQIGHVFQRSVPTYKPLLISGVIYASPIEYPVQEWGVSFEPAAPLRLLPNQRTAFTQAWVVSGDSMAPTIKNGEVVLVEPSEAFSTHLPCAFMGPYGVMVKRRGVVGGRNCLISDNPDVPPCFDLEYVTALGGVRAIYVGPRRTQSVS